MAAAVSQAANKEITAITCHLATELPPHHRIAAPGGAAPGATNHRPGGQDRLASPPPGIPGARRKGTVLSPGQSAPWREDIAPSPGAGQPAGRKGERPTAARYSKKSPTAPSREPGQGRRHWSGR